MSQETVDVVRRWFDRLDAGDPAPDLCSPDIEIRNWSESMTPGPYHGHDGLHRWWREANDPDVVADIRWFRLEEIIEVDETSVVAVQRAHARARYTGLEADLRWGAVVSVRGGKIVSAFGYSTPEAAKQAAGLRE
jgi:ketosteroid isomerase-like protein